MKIAIDRGPLDDLNATRGVGSYTKNLVAALQTLGRKEGFTIEAIDAQATDLKQFDIVHYPYFDFFKNTLRLNKGIKTVVTVHDTIPLLYPEHYPIGLKGKVNLHLQKRSLKQTNHIITVSETSKKDIIRMLSVEPASISVVYEGPTVSEVKLSAAELNGLRKKYNLPDKYILYVGDVNWNKNLLTLCSAAEKTKTHLVIIGKAAVNTVFDHKHIENKPLVTLQEKYGNSPYIHRLGFVEESLNGFFALAICYCQPSYYEGFGLSVLDALLLKTPVLCAKTQALVELYEGAVTFFDPYSVEELTILIKKLGKDSTQALLVKNGYQLAQKFSWEKAAMQTYEVYKNLLSK
jgi:glycosyltransferase involved in cell wall biosynthesis